MLHVCSKHHTGPASELGTRGVGQGLGSAGVVGGQMGCADAWEPANVCMFSNPECVCVPALMTVFPCQPKRRGLGWLCVLFYLSPACRYC